MTNTIFEALCGSGFASVRYMLECHTNGGHNAGYQLPVRSRVGTRSPSNHTAHDVLMQLYAHASDPSSAGNLTVRDWIHGSVSALEKVARHSSHSIMDSPYASFPAVMASQGFRAALPLTLLRKHAEWARSRILEHEDAGICHPRLWWHALTPNVSDPLDLLQCAWACLLSLHPRQAILRTAGCFEIQKRLSTEQLSIAHAMNERHVADLFGSRLMRLPLFASSMGVHAISAWLLNHSLQQLPAHVGRPGAFPRAPSLVVVAVMKWETAYIHEWLAYHQSLGVTDFVLIPNECHPEATRALHAAISPLLTPGISVIHHFQCAASFFQGKAYAAAVWHLLKERPELDPSTTRVAFYDVDEFLVAPLMGNLGTLLAGLPADADAWHLADLAFGSSDRRSRPLRGGVLANYVLRADTGSARIRVGNAGWQLGCSDEFNCSTNIAAALLYKSVCKLSTLALRTHFALADAYSVQPPQMAPNAAHDCFNPTANVTTYAVPEEQLRLHHFTSKSEAEWEVKKTRGRADQSPHSRVGSVPKAYSSVVDLGAPLTLLSACSHTNASPCATLVALTHDTYPTRVAQLLQEWCSKCHLLDAAGSSNSSAISAVGTRTSLKTVCTRLCI